MPEKKREMNEIKLRRGRGEVTFKKMPQYFAVRLKQGKANSTASLEASCGPTRDKVSHIESAETENMEIFAVSAKQHLEKTVDDFRKAPASDVISHVYSIDNSKGIGVVPTGTMTIQFQAETTKDEREEVLRDFGLEVMEDIDYLPNGYTVRLTEASKENPLKISKKLQEHEGIVVAEPDISFQISLKHVPTDALYPGQWHLKNRGDRLGLKSGSDVSAEGAWDHTTGSREVVVCVMDDGFDLDHPEFSTPGKVVHPRDFGQNDFNPNPVFKDDNHGTACAGVAIAEENGVGVVGLAPQCSFMPVRTSGWLSDNAVVSLFQYAIDKNADVISCSWSAASWNFPLSTKIEGIIHKAATEGRSNKKGCVILFAAGNEDRPLEGVKDGNISHQGFALHPDIIAVAASNSLDGHSYYSNYGPEIAISAPSSGSPGRGILTTDRRGRKGYSTGDYTPDFGGTSSSTPLAAGLAALILSINPSLTSAEVKGIMMDTADKIDETEGNYIDGHSEQFGHGRINALKALEYVNGTGDSTLPETLFIEHRVNRSIPDLGETDDPISFPLDVSIREIEINVEIRHTWRGDLKIILKPPNTGEIVLQNGTGGSQDDIIKSYRSTDEPSLFDSLIGKSAEGEWRLTIVDMAGGDVGVLVKWGLTVTYQGE